MCLCCLISNLAIKDIDKVVSKYARASEVSHDCVICCRVHRCPEIVC